MINSQKISIRKIISRCTKSFVLVFTIFASAFLIGCGKSTQSESGFDEKGRYRLNSVEVLHYSQTASGKYDENTGSF